MKTKITISHKFFNIKTLPKVANNICQNKHNLDLQLPPNFHLLDLCMSLSCDLCFCILHMLH